MLKEEFLNLDLNDITEIIDFCEKHRCDEFDYSKLDDLQELYDFYVTFNELITNSKFKEICLIKQREIPEIYRKSVKAASSLRRYEAIKMWNFTIKNTTLSVKILDYIQEVLKKQKNGSGIVLNIFRVDENKVWKKCHTTPISFIKSIALHSGEDIENKMDIMHSIAMTIQEEALLELSIIDLNSMDEISQIIINPLTNECIVTGTNVAIPEIEGMRII